MENNLPEIGDLEIPVKTTKQMTKHEKIRSSLVFVHPLESGETASSGFVKVGRRSSQNLTFEVNI